MESIKNNLYIKIVFAIFSGAILPFSFAPYAFYLIAFFSITILFYLWSISTSKESFLIGYLFGFAYFGIGINWLHISINVFSNISFIGALFLTYLLVSFMALYPAICGYLAVSFYKDKCLIIFPFIWVIIEWCRGWLLTGFPWLNLGTGQIDSLLSHYIPIIGDYGISLIVCLIASCLVILIIEKTKQKIISLIIISMVIGVTFYINDIKWTKENGKYLNIAMIQGAIPQELKWRQEQRENTYDIYSKLSAPFWSSDLIIWPETAIPSFYHLADDFLDRISEKKKKSDTLFMSGLTYKEKDNRYFNSILLIDKKHHFYHKHHLVPFGEYLPVKSILDKIVNFLGIPIPNFSSGNQDKKLFITNKAIFGMSICYEDVFGSEIRRAMPHANILINVSNDAWFGDSIAPHQHLQIARMRAVENGRYLLRSTNTGISAVINEKGKIISQSSQFIPHALSATVKLFEGSTPYSRYGNTLIISLSFIFLILNYFFKRKRS